VELRHLRYFVVVAETLNYRRAAEQLRVAQPALSRQIKDLEHAVGARLLDRNTGGVRLTDAGSILLDEARDILERVAMAGAAAREAAGGRGGRLSIGNLGAMLASFLPAALSAFRARYPKVEVNLQEMSMSDQLAALKSGTIQVGFMVDKGSAIPADLERLPIAEERLAVALGSDHRLAGRPRVALAELVDEQLLFIGQSEQHDLHRQRIHAIFAARGIRHRPIRRVNSFESLVALVAGDHGLSIMLPTFVARSTDNIVFRRIKEDGDDLLLRLVAVWRRDGSSQLARNFVEVLPGLRGASARIARAG
jgi:DNA-binding transcriptional LysR family regulator